MVSPRTPHFKVGACAALRFFAKVSVFFAPPAKLEIETTLKWGDGGGTSGMKGLGPVSVFFAPTGNEKMCVSSMGHAQARQIYPARIPRATARVRARDGILSMACILCVCALTKANRHFLTCGTLCVCQSKRRYKRSMAASADARGLFVFLTHGGLQARYTPTSRCPVRAAHPHAYGAN